MAKRVTIAPLQVTVADPAWHSILGVVLELTGGTELVKALQPHPPNAPDVRSVYIINDPYFPSVSVIVDPEGIEVCTQDVPEGEHGPRVGKGRMRCTAGVHRRRPGASSDNCLPCYYQRWTARARAAGMNIESEEH